MNYLPLYLPSGDSKDEHRWWTYLFIDPRAHDDIIVFFHGGGGRACDWQKFETGGIFGVY